jgi:hypothetical protein
MILGITGHMQAGKDSIGKILVKRGFKQLALADNVRKAALLLDPIVFVDTYGNPVKLTELVNAWGWEEAKKYQEVRRTLQVLGSEIGREMFGMDSWINMLKIEGDCVITDVRFFNEAAWIKAQGGQVWKVERPGHSGDNHQSEAQVDFIAVDVVIQNDGTLEDLEKRITEYMNAKSVS